MATRVECVRIRGYAWGGDRRPTAARTSGTIAPVLAIALLAAGITHARTTPPRTVTVPARPSIHGVVSFSDLQGRLRSPRCLHFHRGLRTRPHQTARPQSTGCAG